MFFRPCSFIREAYNLFEQVWTCCNKFFRSCHFINRKQHCSNRSEQTLLIGCSTTLQQLVLTSRDKLLTTSNRLSVFARVLPGVATFKHLRTYTLIPALFSIVSSSPNVPKSATKEAWVIYLSWGSCAAANVPMTTFGIEPWCQRSSLTVRLWKFCTLTKATRNVYRCQGYARWMRNFTDCHVKRCAVVWMIYNSVKMWMLRKVTSLHWVLNITFWGCDWNGISHLAAHVKISHAW